ncbi:MAG: chorismate mutase [Rickettsiales bacterium]|nr:chorismate mutase [Rickettsiales bacterium]|tara:strand:- start:10083 stop:10460 length:378 start_codon:yes stop_codon:yes gene_type:complete
MTVRGIRGAITVSENTINDIIEDTKILLTKMIAENDIDQTEIVSIFFSITKDLNATFPAKAARELGLHDTPLLCLNELDVPNSLEKVIRILMHVNSLKKQTEMKHIYLKEAIKLRPDLSKDSYNL